MSIDNLKRKIFFWTLVLLFLFTAPSIVLYAKGYRFDLKRGVFVHSGGISIKINPQKFELYINGKIEESRNLNMINSSYNIPGLIPGEYNVRIASDGFSEWSKKIKVTSGKTTEFWNILLVKNDYERNRFGLNEIDDFFISPKDQLVASIRNTNLGSNLTTISIKNKEKVNSLFLPGGNFLRNEREENIEWSPQEDFLSIPLKMKDEKKAKTIFEKSKKTNEEEAEKDEFQYFIMDLKENSYSNLSDISGKNNIRKVRWHPEEKGLIFFLSEDSLFLMDVKNPQNIKNIAENVSAYDLSKTAAYYSAMGSELVFKTDLSGNSKEQITFSFPEKNPKKTEKLIVYDDSRISFIDEDKSLYIFNKGETDNYFKKLGNSINGVQFSNDGKKIIYWSTNEISVNFLRKWEVQPERIENETNEITRFSSPIKNVQWFKDYEHVIFSVGNQIKIIELDSRDRRNYNDIANLNIENSKVVYNHYLENLFFIEKVNDIDFDLESIQFPEKTNILGL